MALAFARDERLHQFYRYWNSLRDGSAVPSLSDFDPTEVPRHLPLIWLVGWDAEAGDYVYRVAGEMVLAAHQCPMRGVPLSQIYRSAVAATVRNRFNRICREANLYYAAGTIYSEPDRFGVGERLVLPMVGQDGSDMQVLGCTVSRVTRRPAADALFDPNELPEIQAYLDLNGAPLPDAIVSTGQRTSA